MDAEITNYKQIQEQIKEEELTYLELKAELEMLVSKKAKLQSKSDEEKDKIRELASKFHYLENEREKLGMKAQELEN